MPKKKNIGLTIFGVCCVIYARTAFLAPTQEELKDPSIAEQSRDYRAEEDPEGLFHGLRYYVLGVGVIGLLIAVEDHFLERSKNEKLKRPPSGEAHS